MCVCVCERGKNWKTTVNRRLYTLLCVLVTPNEKDNQRERERESERVKVRVNDDNGREGVVKQQMLLAAAAAG